MPEYSSTTITPADGVQLPAQNGATSGNFTLSALRSFILASKGQANGLAGLGSDGKLDPSQVPGNLDDVLVYATRSNFPAAGTAGKIYIAADTNIIYRWDPDLSVPAYVELSVDLSDYATEAELTNLKNAIDSNTARIENLEQEHGGYYDVDVKSVYTIPSGKAKNWSVNVLRGVTRAKNQLGTLFATEETWTSSVYEQLFSFLPHKYLCFFQYKFNTLNQSFRFRFNSSEWTINDTISASDLNWHTYAKIADETHTLSSRIQFRDPTFDSSSIQLYQFNVVDLNVYFGGSIPSDADTIAEIQQNYPELLVPSAYGNSLVSTTYEEVRSKARNLLDRTQATEGKILDASGTLVSLSGCAVSDYIPITPSVLYYLKSTAINNQYQVHWFDINKTWIGRNLGSTSNSTTSNANAFYARVNFQTSDTSVCFNKSDSQDGTFTPFFTDTLSLPSPITLRSAGTVAEEFDLETGEKTNVIGSYTFDGTEAWVRASNYYKTTIFNGLIKRPSGYNDIPNVICSEKYIPTNWTNGTPSYCLYVAPVAEASESYYVWFKDVDGMTNAQFSTYMTGKTVYFELATASDPTSLDPGLNNFLPTESGGTISSILTDAVDDSMTLGYINL